MNTASIQRVDGDQLQLTVHARRIPALARAPLEEVAALLSQANATLAEARQDAERLREEARQQGYADGRRAAAADAAQQLLQVQAQAQAFADDGEARIVALAMAVVHRILPSLRLESRVAELAVDAVRALQAERWLILRVHPEAVADVTARRDALAQAQPSVQRVQVIGDAQLGPLDCVAESDLGVVRAGVADQLARLHEDLLRAAREPSA